MAEKKTWKQKSGEKILAVIWNKTETERRDVKSGVFSASRKEQA
jgi:hypothetical protein